MFGLKRQDLILLAQQGCARTADGRCIQVYGLIRREDAADVLAAARAARDLGDELAALDYPAARQINDALSAIEADYLGYDEDASQTLTFSQTKFSDDDGL